MNTRLIQLINYVTQGNKAEFARIMEWTPQYVSNLIKGSSSMGINPVLALLAKFPELNARWLLLGEGAMLNSINNAMRQKMLHLLELEQYLPVMSAEEQQRIIDGDIDFDRNTIAKWRALLGEHNTSLQTRFDNAFARQQKWLDEGQNK